MLRRHQLGRLAVALGVVVSLFIIEILPIQAQEGSTLPPLVEVYWNSNRTLTVLNATNIVVLDPDIAEVNLEGDRMEFVGVSRGETVVLVTVDGKQVSTRVRVVARPAIPVNPNIAARQEELAHGTVSSTVQVANSATAGSNVSILNAFNWSQSMGPGRRLDFFSQFESDSAVQSRPFNIRRGSLFYTTPKLDLRVFDFDASMTGAPQNYASQFSFNDTMDLRGAQLTLKGDRNTYSFFGGTTIPYYYLILGSTRDVAAFTFQRQQTDNLLLYANSSFIDAPVDITGVQQGRIKSFMQTAGLAYRLRNRWYARATGGISNHGGMGQTELDFTGRKMSAFVAGSLSSPLFPLNQLQSVFAGTTFLKAGWMLRNSNWLSESVFYQHTITKPAGSIIKAGTSDYLSPGIWMRFKRGQDLNATYTYSRQSGGFLTGASSGNRFDFNWHSQFRRGISNSAQFTVGSLQDALQLNSEDQFSFTDSFAMPIKGGDLLLGFQHSRTNPSLVSRVNSELWMLSPALQQLFLQDPVSFVNSGNLPPDIRALVEATQPASTSISAAGQFRLGKKIMVNPTFSLARTSNANSQSWTPFLGYSFAYQVRPTLQLTSSLTNVWILTAGQFTPQRTTVFSFGVTKSFAVVPFGFNPMGHGRSIHGEVFRDNNINGDFTAGEPGLAGIEVRLDNGESTTTDKEGRYQFRGVSAGIHQVSISLDQFQGPVRMTTPGAMEVDVIREKQASVNFGIIDFARVMGNVFNDLRFHNVREPDAKGMPEIKMTLEADSWKRNLVTNGTGDYEVDDVPPGKYTLTVDAGSVPANYTITDRSFPVVVTPVSTVVQDVPVRALRSISGTVFLQVPADPTKPGSKPTLVPIADVQITAGYGVAITDKYGDFILRDLPSGDLTITLVPVRTPPPDLKVPSGKVHMPADPIQVKGASIVISNPDLVQYLVGKTATQVKEEGMAVGARR